MFCVRLKADTVIRIRTIAVRTASALISALTHDRFKLWSCPSVRPYAAIRYSLRSDRRLRHFDENLVNRNFRFRHH